MHACAIINKKMLPSVFLHIFALTYLNPKTLTGLKMKEIHLYYALLMFFKEL